jgi:hypothetical protein
MKSEFYYFKKNAIRPSVVMIQAYPVNHIRANLRSRSGVIRLHNPAK